jgi:hypothetical protein
MCKAVAADGGFASLPLGWRCSRGFGSLLKPVFSLCEPGLTAAFTSAASSAAEGLTIAGTTVIWQVLHRFSKLAIVTVLALSIGLHWGLLQSVAWVGMVVNYSRDAGFRQALEKTFDGKHPCALCKAIAEGKKSEKRPESGPVAKQLEFSYSRTVFVFCAPTHFWEVGGLDERADAANSPPPVPPPKAVLG